MKKLFFLLALSAGLFAYGPVLKYAFNDTELADRAQRTATLLKEHNVHLGLIERSALFEKEGGLAALKMGYIELYAANAVDLQYVIGGIWPKLEAAKNGNDATIRRELNELGFELIAVRFLPKKTVIILGASAALGRLNAEQRKLLENL